LRLVIGKTIIFANQLFPRHQPLPGGIAMFTALADFISAWNDESASTRKMLAELTDASLTQPVGGDHRTLGRIAWHLTQSITEMGGKVGLVVKGPGEHDPVPGSAKAIAEAYDAAAGSVAGAIYAAKWTDAELETTREMYGETWKVAFALRVIVLHEVHHRGQMTILMRQAGLRVPGVYGPAKEDWATYGMTPPAI
jgi:uncharacterized damage-inducible protein DinB